VQLCFSAYLRKCSRWPNRHDGYSKTIYDLSDRGIIASTRHNQHLRLSGLYHL